MWNFTRSILCKRLSYHRTEDKSHTQSDMEKREKRVARQTAEVVIEDTVEEGKAVYEERNKGGGLINRLP